MSLLHKIMTYLFDNYTFTIIRMRESIYIKVNDKNIIYEENIIEEDLYCNDCNMNDLDNMHKFIISCLKKKKYCDIKIINNDTNLSIDFNYQDDNNEYYYSENIILKKLSINENGTLELIKLKEENTLELIKLKEENKNLKILVENKDTTLTLQLILLISVAINLIAFKLFQSTLYIFPD